MLRLTGAVLVLSAVALIAPSPASAQDRDCSDFDTQAEAQDFFDQAAPGDPHGLDADDDGRACDAKKKSAPEPNSAR